MMQVQVIDRHGRRIDGDVVPDGATVRVPVNFADALSSRTRRAFADADNRPLLLDLAGQPAGFRPGYAFAARDYRAPPQMDAYPPPVGETARQRYLLRLGEAWKAMNLRPPLRDVPRAQRISSQQGRAGADAAPDRSTDAACEEIREAAHQSYADRIANAWRT
jgi:hypothetical protein